LGRESAYFLIEITGFFFDCGDLLCYHNSYQRGVTVGRAGWSGSSKGGNGGSNGLAV